MSALEFKAARGRLGQRMGLGRPIPVVAYARMLEIDRATVYRYERGQADVPEKVRLRVERFLKLPQWKLRIPQFGWRRKVLRKNRRFGYSGPREVPSRFPDALRIPLKKRPRPPRPGRRTPEERREARRKRREEESGEA